MNEMVRRLVSRVVEKFAGTGVEIDGAGRLCLPDGLDADRAHRFIELCLDERYANPKEALNALFARVGIEPSALAVLEEIIGDRGQLDLSAVARSPLKMSGAASSLLEIPTRIHGFLVDGLALADPSCETLEEAVVSTRRRAAERLDCPPSWDEILARPVDVVEVARDWRERSAPAAD